MSSFLVVGLFTENGGVPKTGLTLAEVTFYLTRRLRITGVISAVWNGTQTADSELTSIGAYLKEYSSADETLYDYFARVSYTGAAVLDSDHVTGVLSQSELAKDVDEYHTEDVTQTTLAAKIYHGWARWYNKVTQTTTQQKVYKADAVTVMGTAGVSDTGVTQERGAVS